ncbi:hypothetical protein EVAR_40578_1 [Eumeta japonica]|uniref:Uncharacterized protein n=1 Tax=Eumeta variegata TaxID=151549 RepID=A0A4C1VVE4_EUMVA|nr:hypothetical protein EVAR_40578_1 [Eumeta japonica]
MGKLCKQLIYLRDVTTLILHISKIIADALDNGDSVSMMKAFDSINHKACNHAIGMVIRSHHQHEMGAQMQQRKNRVNHVFQEKQIRPSGKTKTTNAAMPKTK